MFLVSVDLPDWQMENVTEIQMLPEYTVSKTALDGK